MPEPSIEEIEEELRRSQFTEWETERFIATRHRNNLETAKKEPEEPEISYWPKVKSAIGTFLFRTWLVWMAFGAIIMLGKWLGIWNGLS